MKSFSEERNLTKNGLKLRLKFARKLVVNMQFATMKYAIIRNPMVLERVEVNSFKYVH